MSLRDADTEEPESQRKDWVRWYTHGSWFQVWMTHLIDSAQKKLEAAEVK